MATVLSYKVGNASGAPDDDCVLQALKAIIAQIKSRKGASGYKGSVIHMYIAATRSNDLRTQISLAIQNQITVIGTAGNDNADASGYFPCSYYDVI